MSRQAMTRGLLCGAYHRRFVGLSSASSLSHSRSYRRRFRQGNESQCLIKLPILKRQYCMLDQLQLLSKAGFRAVICAERSSTTETEEGGWEKLWDKGVSPWDLGGITPAIAQHLARAGVPDGNILVPGCGTGYDVLAMASPTRHVVGLDISPTAIARAQKMVAGKPNAEFTEFVEANFFTFTPTTNFTFIFDYTFFCAINPELREKWGSKIAELLAPDGDLLTLVFPIGDYEGGPPFAVSLQAYEAVLHPHGFEATVIPYDGSAPPRKDLEQLYLWKRLQPKL